MIRVDEWTDFEAHDLAELALSVSDEIRGHGGTGEAELARLDAWLDETIAEGDCDEVRRQLLQGFYQTLGFRGDWQDYFSSANCDLDQVLVSIHRNSIDTGKMRRSSLDPTFLLA